MSVYDAVFDAVRYYRFRGAALSNIDSYSGIRTEKADFNNQRAKAIAQLECDHKIERRGKLWFLHPLQFRKVGGPAFKPEFETMDFSVLMAILGNGKGCDLQTLIGAFDF